MKRCKKCGLEKPLDDFYRAAGTRDGHRGDCKACNLAEPSASGTSLTREEPIAAASSAGSRRIPSGIARTSGAMRSTPEGKRAAARRPSEAEVRHHDRAIRRIAWRVRAGGCAICGREPRPDISLHLDHDHETGQLRGILCFRCNNALGDFDDDPGAAAGGAPLPRVVPAGRGRGGADPGAGPAAEATGLSDLRCPCVRSWPGRALNEPHPEPAAARPPPAPAHPRRPPEGPRRRASSPTSTR